VVQLVFTAQPRMQLACT